MKNYQEFKQHESERSNKLYSEIAFFAFSNQQFNEGLEKLGVKKEDIKEKLVSIGGGGYALKSRAKELIRLSNNYIEKLIELMQDENFAVSAFNYELSNHEYCISMDETEAVNALGYSLSDIDKNEHLKKCLYKAIQIQREWAMENC